MAKESVRIELNEKDIKELVAQKWGLDLSSCTISVSHWKGDAREPEYTNIVVTGQKSSSKETAL
jgi:hypothetical protein